MELPSRVDDRRHVEAASRAIQHAAVAADDRASKRVCERRGSEANEIEIDGASNTRSIIHSIIHSFARAAAASTSISRMTDAEAEDEERRLVCQRCQHKIFAVDSLSVPQLHFLVTTLRPKQQQQLASNAFRYEAPIDADDVALVPSSPSSSSSSSAPSNVSSLAKIGRAHV